MVLVEIFSNLTALNKMLINMPGSSKIYKLACASIEDSEQPVHPQSLIRVFDGCSMGSQVSRTPDRDFLCFYPCEIVLFHLPVPARGKDKK